MKNAPNTEPSGLYRGIGIGTGKTAGSLHFFKKNTPVKQKKRGTVGSAEQETSRVRAAIRTVKQRLSALRSKTAREVGEEEAEIFAIHEMLLEDEDFTDALTRALTPGISAEDATKEACDTVCSRLLSLQDPYLSARAADVRDVSSQLLSVLSGEEESDAASSVDPYILVAEDLTPSQTVSLERSHILGFVTMSGSPSSHTAILARAMGIPALVSVGTLPTASDGAFALLDAENGCLTVSPTDEQIADFERKRAVENELAVEHDRYLRSLINKPAVTRSGHRMLIYANVGGEEDVRPALLNGADGIGLLRSEFLYLSLDRYPTEEELFRSYRKVASEMEGKRIVIRTLDIGADKQISYFGLPKEENPALGFRAVRICLSRLEIFKTQLRAILRASALGTISVMIPMIVSVDEVRQCRALLEECKSELSREGKSFDPRIEFGIMIETPAAAIMSRELAAEVDFFSVGTNDLTQYTLAADRQNPALSGITEKNTEPILRLIEASARAIHDHDGWIGICGELAADLRLTQRFADMGIDELSVSSPYLLGVREKVIECK